MKENQFQTELLNKFSALKADIILTETDPEKRDEKIEKLRETEKQNLNQLNSDIDEMKLLLKESEEWAQFLKIKPLIALELLILRETRRIHYHEDEMLK